LLGGLVTGVLSALPIVSAGNICCCLWVVSGGLLSAYLLQQNRPDPITPSDGAIVGLLAGAIGAVVQFALSIPIGLLIAPMERNMLMRLRELSGSVSPALGDLGGPGALGTILLAVVGLLFWLIVGSVVSTVAGVVGAALFATRPASLPPSSPADIPDTPPGF
jgi:hypothetical protein